MCFLVSLPFLRQTDFLLPFKLTPWRPVLCVPPTFGTRTMRNFSPSPNVASWPWPRALPMFEDLKTFYVYCILYLYLFFYRLVYSINLKFIYLYEFWDCMLYFYYLLEGTCRDTCTGIIYTWHTYVCMWPHTYVYLGTHTPDTRPVINAGPRLPHRKTQPPPLNRGNSTDHNCRKSWARNKRPPRAPRPRWIHHRRCGSRRNRTSVAFVWMNCLRMKQN